MDQQRRGVGVGLTGFASLPAANPAALSVEHLQGLESVRELLSGHRLALLTGAGLSTDSGIPDYRGPDSVPRSPMTYQEFVRDPANRQRYWARNHIGWSHLGMPIPTRGTMLWRNLNGGGC